MLAIILIIVFIMLILNPSISSLSILEVSKLWINNLVPILFPSLIIIDLLNNDKSIEILSHFLFPTFKKIFNIRYPKSSFIILLSFICGVPGSTKIIVDALTNNEIDSKEANNLIYSLSCFSLPYTIFILNKANLSIPLYFITFILFAIFTMQFLNKGDAKLTDRKTIKNPFFKNVITSVNKNINVLISILGIIMFFKIIINLFNINDYLYLFLEPLGGHNSFLILNINKKLKAAIIASSLSFLGISIHLQMYYVFDEIKYKNFLFFRAIQAAIIFLIFLI